MKVSVSSFELREGKPSILGLTARISKPNPLGRGTVESNEFYNMFVGEEDEYEIGEEFDIELSGFTIRESEYINNKTGLKATSIWLS